jgi:hypothetical protein
MPAAGAAENEACVRYMHYVEGLHRAILSAGAHGDEADDTH